MRIESLKDKLEILADKMDMTWSEVDFDSRKFADLAYVHLSSFAWSEKIEMEDFSSFLQSRLLPKQQYPNNEFADLALTLVDREHFLIDIYVWFHSDTSIHNHHFAGAFKQLQGRSVQMEYEFKQEVEIFETLTQGRLEVRTEKKINPGDVIQINPLKEFIHDIIHLEEQTITLCLRTKNYMDVSLSNYIFPKYRLEQRPFQPNVAKQVKLFALNNKNKSSMPPCFTAEEMARLLYRELSVASFLPPGLADHLKSELTKISGLEDFTGLLEKQVRFRLKQKIISGKFFT